MTIISLQQKRLERDSPCEEPATKKLKRSTHTENDKEQYYDRDDDDLAEEDDDEEEEEEGQQQQQQQQQVTNSNILSTKTKEREFSELCKDVVLCIFQYLKINVEKYVYFLYSDANCRQLFENFRRRKSIGHLEGGSSSSTNGTAMMSGDPLIQLIYGRFQNDADVGSGSSDTNNNNNNKKGRRIYKLYTNIVLDWQRVQHEKALPIIGFWQQYSDKMKLLSPLSVYTHLIANDLRTVATLANINTRIINNRVKSIHMESMIVFASQLLFFDSFDHILKRFSRLKSLSLSGQPLKILSPLMSQLSNQIRQLEYIDFIDEEITDEKTIETILQLPNLKRVFFNIGKKSLASKSIPKDEHHLRICLDNHRNKNLTHLSVDRDSWNSVTKNQRPKIHSSMLGELMNAFPNLIHLDVGEVSSLKSMNAVLDKCCCSPSHISSLTMKLTFKVIGDATKPKTIEKVFSQLSERPMLRRLKLRGDIETVLTGINDPSPIFSNILSAPNLHSLHMQGLRGKYVSTILSLNNQKPLDQRLFRFDIPRASHMHSVKYHKYGYLYNGDSLLSKNYHSSVGALRIGDVEKWIPSSHREWTIYIDRCFNPSMLRQLAEKSVHVKINNLLIQTSSFSDRDFNELCRVSAEDGQCLLDRADNVKFWFAPMTKQTRLYVMRNEKVLFGNHTFEYFARN